MHCLVSDAKSEARQIARMAFFKYKIMMPERAASVFQSLDNQYQRAILEDEKSGNVGPGGFSPLKYSESN